MNRKIKSLIIVGVFLAIIVFYALFFCVDEIETMCLEECEDMGAVFIKYEISETYEFIQCICSLEGDAKTPYFDLNTRERLTTNDILGRVIG